MDELKFRPDHWSWFREWQYNGNGPMEDIVSWCRVTLPPRSYMYNGWEYIEFYDEASYVLFVLRWS